MNAISEKERTSQFRVAVFRSAVIRPKSAAKIVLLFFSSHAAVGIESLLVEQAALG